MVMGRWEGTACSSWYVLVDQGASALRERRWEQTKGAAGVMGTKQHGLFAAKQRHV